MPSDPISRRTFVGNAAKTAAALSVAPLIVPRRVLGGVDYQPPSRTLNVACVGIGGMGMENMRALVAAGENIVAVCDIDYGYVERSLAGRLRTPVPPPNATPEQIKTQQANYAMAQRLRDAYVKAAKYTDFREMLEKRKDIDAVFVATPDHLHAVIAAAAMRAGKHVYVQKPLTYTVQEARTLARLAKETGVVTQMGNQGHSYDGTRRIVELIGAGTIGSVREVHVWTDRPQRYWAQGIPGPTQIPAYLAAKERMAQQTAQQASAAAQTQTDGQPLVPAAPRWNIRTVENAILEEMARNPTSPPPGLDWDRFLGPAKPLPYHPAYHPFSWRGWVPFGVSAIGDMGAHLMDQPYWALGLGYPTSIVASSTPWGGPASDPASYPLAMTARYEFAARGRNMPAVTLHWYDGGLMPTLDREIVFPGGDGGGGIFVGDKGYLTYETYGNNPKVYPEAAARKGEKVKPSVPRITVSHEQNFAQACKGEAEASCPFSYAAPLTELMLLGVVALRAGQGRKLEYDGANMRVTNIPAANAFLTREYRAGWSL